MSVESILFVFTSSYDQDCNFCGETNLAVAGRRNASLAHSLDSNLQYMITIVVRNGFGYLDLSCLWNYW